MCAPWPGSRYLIINVARPRVVSETLPFSYVAYTVTKQFQLGLLIMRARCKE